MAVGGSASFIVRYRVAIKLGLSALVVAGTADLFAGLLLTHMEDQLTTVVGMLILIYSAIGMRGTIFGAMGSRIGTSMNIGTFEMSLRKGTVLRANIEATLLLTLIMSELMGFTTWIVSMLFFGGNTGLQDFIFVSSIGGTLAGFTVLMCNIVIAYAGYRKEWDVDNITAPLISAIGDIVTLPMIFISTILCMHIDAHFENSLIISGVSIQFVAGLGVFLLRTLVRKSSNSGFDKEQKRIIVESIPILVFCLIFEIFAGIVIQNKQDELIAYSAFMIMMPAFLDQGNALTGMLTSRLGSLIHLGTLEKTAIPGKLARENFVFIGICGIPTFLYLGAIAYFASYLSGGPDSVSLWISLEVILISGIIAMVILNLVSYYIAILSDRAKLDPDDHCIPITSSVSDLVSAVILTAVIAIIV